MSAAGAKKRKSVFETLSKVYDQVNPLDNNLTYKQRTPTTNKSAVSQLGQVGGQTARAVAGNTSRFLNTANLGVRQIADTARLTAANLTNNSLAARNAIQDTKQDYNRFTTKGGILNTGTFFQSPEEAASGEFKTVARRIGGGTLGTAAEVVPFARGATLVKAGGSVLPNVARGAAEGAGYGAVGGAGNELVQGQGFNIRNVIKSAAAGAALGGAIPAAAGAVKGATRVGQSAVNDYKAMTPEERQAGFVKIPGSTPAGSTTPVANPKVATAPTPMVKTRGFTESVRTSPEVSQTVREKVSGTYDPRSTSELAGSAEVFAKKGLKGVVKDVNDRLAAKTGAIDDRTVADAIAVAKRLDSKGDFDGASVIYDRLAEHGTKLGQDVQAFALLSRRTPEGVLFKAQRDLKKAGVELTPEINAKLSGLKEAIAKTQPGTEARDMATHRMLQYVSSKLPSSTGSKVVNIWRAGLLTSPITTAGNLLSNTANAAVRTGFTNPLAAAADTLFSAFTGKRTKTLTTRGLAGGAGEGVKRGGTYLKTGFDKRMPGDKYDIRQVNYGNNPIGKFFKGYTDAVYRWMGAQDQPFYYSAKRQSLYDQALAEAKNRGLKGSESSTFVEDFVESPPRAAAKRAQDDAEYSVFQNETAISTMVQGAKKFLQNKGFDNAAAALDFIIPFSRVPAAVATRVLTNTPLGVAKEIVSQIKKGKFDQRAMSEAIANGMVGPAMFGVGYALHQAGDMTLGYPADRNEQDLWKLEGKQPYSVKVGDQWLSMNYLQPFGTLMAIGAQFNQSKKDGESTTGSSLSATGTAAQSIVNQSFLKGVAGTLSAINDPARYAESFAENTAGSVVPNIVRTATRAADPVQREVNGPVEAIKGGLPGLRDDLAPALDVFGRPLPARTSTANQLANPLRPSDIRSGDPLVDELRRLQDAGKGVLPSELKKTSLGQDKALNPKQLHDMQQKIGPEVYAAWQKVTADPRYVNMNDEDKMKALRKASETITEARKLEYGVNNNIIGESDLKDSAGRSKLNTEQKRLLEGNLVDFLSKTTNLTPAERYQQAVDSFESDKSGMSTSDKFKAENNLKKLKVGINYDDDTVNVYGLSQDKIADYLDQNPSDALVSKLYEYDQALIDAGVTKKSKFEKYTPGERPSTKGKKGGISTARGKFGSTKGAPTPKIKIAGTVAKVTIRKRARGKSTTLKIKKG